MKFDIYLPTQQLRRYIKYFAVSENDSETEYKVFPTSGLVIGFQYKGQLAIVSGHKENKLDTAGVTGISDSYKIFKNSAGIGTVLVFFTETGFTNFVPSPAHELFNLSVSLENIFKKETISAVEEQLQSASSDLQRVAVVEQFLCSRLKERQTDSLITEAVKLIHQSKGTIRIKDLKQKLYISPSPLEKRFRAIVGTTPKKFASIVRFNAVMDDLKKSGSPLESLHGSNYFDQAHFIRDFKHFTGYTPENFKRSL